MHYIVNKEARLTPRSFITTYLYSQGGKATLEDLRKAYREAITKGIIIQTSNGELEKWLRWHVTVGNIKTQDGTLVLDNPLPKWVRRVLEEKKQVLQETMPTNN